MTRVPDPFNAKPIALPHWPPTAAEWKLIEAAIRRDRDWLAFYRYFGWPLDHDVSESRFSVDRKQEWVRFHGVPTINFKGEPDNASLTLSFSGKALVSPDAKDYQKPGRYWRYLPSALRQAKAVVKQEVQLLREASKWVDTVYFVRFGKPPRDGISRGRIRGLDIIEKGVSVYAAEFNPKTRRWSLEVPENDTGWPTLDAHLGGHRRVWLLQGEIVGEGADGEPVLKDVHVVQELHRCDLEVNGMFDPEEGGEWDCDAERMMR